MLGETGHERESERPLAEKSKEGTSSILYINSEQITDLMERTVFLPMPPRYSNLVCDAVWQAGTCDCKLEVAHSPEVQAAETFLWQLTSKISCASGTPFWWHQ